LAAFELKESTVLYLQEWPSIWPASCLPVVCNASQFLQKSSGKNFRPILVGPSLNKMKHYRTQTPNCVPNFFLFFFFIFFSLRFIIMATFLAPIQAELDRIGPT